MPLMVESVTGPVEADKLGYVLPHEHLFIDLVKEVRLLGLLHEPDLISGEVQAFMAAGGQTIVDCSSPGIGRNPAGLRSVAEATGATIIMGCGFYRDPYLPTELVDSKDASALAQAMIDEIHDGVGESGIKPGIIGEVGCNRGYTSAREERVLRAAGKAHIATGLTITTHSARWEAGHSQLDILEQEGVSPGCVIIGHSDLLQVDGRRYHLELARRGAYVEFDTFAHLLGDYDLNTRAEYVINLIEAGFIDKILLSHDIAYRNQLTVFGGVGLTFLTDRFRSELLARGVSQDQWLTITVTNPARALTVGQRDGIRPEMAPS